MITKRTFLVLLLILISSGFVVAASEISTNFVIGAREDNIEEYVPRGSLWNNYGSYIIGALIILIVVFVVLKFKVKKKLRKFLGRK